jgi:hypothetical protein
VSVEGPGISHPVEIRGAQRFVHRAGLGLDSKDDAETAANGVNGVKNGEPSSASTTPAPVTNPLSLSDSAKSERVALGAGQPGSVKALGKEFGGASVGAVNWEQQVRRGEYLTVLKDAENKGLQRVLATANSGELLALANAARFSGRVDVGRDAYKAIRQRFGSSSASVSAAFLLGRLMEGSSPTEARRWYERYEQEAPKGALAAEAMGRRLVLTQTTGSRAEVQRLAEEYLRRFPDGPYAGVARKITAP